MNEVPWEQILKKLDTIIKLLAANSFKDKDLNEKVLLMSKLDLQPKEIAELLGKTPNSIRVMLSRMRKKKYFN